MPALDQGPTLAGTDANKNGVRDDIDAVLEHANLTSDVRAASEKLAAQLQALLASPPSDLAAARAAAAALSGDVACLQQQAPTKFRSISTELHIYTFNTAARLDAYVAFEGTLSGQTLTLPKAPSCN
jgi:hypothetical protein